MSIRVRFTAIRQRAKVLHPEAVREDLRNMLMSEAANVIMQTSVYPPPPAPRARGKSSKTGKVQYRKPYKRTFKLLRSWRARPLNVSGSLGIEVLAPARDKRGRWYSGYVHGNEQVWWHAQTGWRKLSTYWNRMRLASKAQAIITKGLEQ